MNITTLANFTTNRDNLSLFRVNCLDEINKAVASQQKFRLHVSDVMQHRFIASIIIMSILIFYQLYFIKYIQPKYSQTEFYKKKIDYRIDLAIIIFMIFNILYLVMM